MNKATVITNGKHSQVPTHLNEKELQDAADNDSLVVVDKALLNQILDLAPAKTRVGFYNSVIKLADGYKTDLKKAKGEDGVEVYKDGLDVLDRLIRTRRLLDWVSPNLIEKKD